MTERSKQRGAKGQTRFFVVNDEVEIQSNRDAFAPFNGQCGIVVHMDVSDRGAFYDVRLDPAHPDDPPATLVRLDISELRAVEE